MTRDRRQAGGSGLPEPVAELAKRDWDAIVVGGGHNGLTAAAYLARAGRSVCVLERRERLGGACTSSSPFADERFVVRPCAYVVGLLDELVIRELELERRGLRHWMADPNLWVPFDDGTSFGQWLDDSRTQANLEELGVSAADIEGYWAYEELFDEVRRKLRQGERDTWVGEAPTRAEIEELLGSDQAMIDLVFEASIADVLDDHLSDERLKAALFGQGIIGTWGGRTTPAPLRSSSCTSRATSTGRGPCGATSRAAWGWSASRSPTRRARRGGPRLRGPGRRDRPRRGRDPGGRHRAPLGHRDLQRRPEADLGMLDGAEVDPAFRERLERGRSAARWSSSTPRSSGCRAGAPRRARAGRPGRRSTSPARSTMRSARSRPASAESRPSASARSTSRPVPTPAPPPRAST